ncbi:MAG: FAD-dependent oxidoreductase, partial [Lachnospiraceae bacterium]|nr:FAD-dependent oxidoreductase [Candidatus Minthocola equi]
MKIVIVGGVAGGASAAARLRRLDEHAQIVMFERGRDVSYANCGLPYYVGGVITEKNDLFLQTPKSFWNRFRIDVRVYQEVISIDRDNRKVKVRNVLSGEEYEEYYDKLVLSPGGEAVVPNIPGADLPGVYKLRSVSDTLCIKELVDTDKVKKAVVVGGGFIGLEMAENLKLRGLDITVIEATNQLFPPFDYEMAGIVKDEFEKNGIHVVLNAPVQEIIQKGDAYQVSCTQNVCFDCDFVVMAIGVRPDTHLAKDAGLALNGRGAIVVDKKLQTSDPDIYAAGDAVEVDHLISGQRVNIPLAGPANKQGRIIAQNLSGQPDEEFDGVIGSSVVKVFSQTMACTGLNEKSLKALGMDYR